MRVGRISKSINDGYFQLKKNGKKNKITEKKFWKLLGGRVGQNCNYVDPDDPDGEAAQHVGSGGYQGNQCVLGRSHEPLHPSQGR